ncbi:MAG: hypothetical protein HOL91_04715, partial [Actinobacteria bacterium]|nr:hypothetical protein [Actinomycetota bacterium]
MLFLPPKHTALAACAGLIASITVTSTTLPASHAAEVGTCYTYAASGTKDQAASAPAVDCRTPHTAQTYWSGTLPANFSVPEKAKASSRLKATRACTSKKMNAFVNLENRELPTRFHSMPVFPTRVQWNAGERWVRCDVVFRSGKAYKKLSVPMAEFAAVTPKDQLNFCTPNVPGNRSTSAY